MPPRKAAPVYYPAGNAYRRSCRRRFFAVCGECRICWAPELILENDKYFLYLRLKENLFTKHFGVVFWVSRQIFNMFVLLRSVKIFYLCLF